MVINNFPIKFSVRPELACRELVESVEGWTENSRLMLSPVHASTNSARTGDNI